MRGRARMCARTGIWSSGTGAVVEAGGRLGLGMALRNANYGAQRASCAGLSCSTINARTDVRLAPGGPSRCPVLSMEELELVALELGLDPELQGAPPAGPHLARRCARARLGVHRVPAARPLSVSRGCGIHRAGEPTCPQADPAGPLSVAIPPARGHRDGPCRPRQDDAARLPSQNQCGSGRGGRHHPAHRRLPRSVPARTCWASEGRS